MPNFVCLSFLTFLTKTNSYHKSGATRKLLTTYPIRFVVGAFTIGLILSLAACAEKTNKTGHQLMPGAYSILFNAGDIEIPARLRITEDNKWCFHNWNETILLDSVVLTDTSFFIKMPLFNTTLEGQIMSDSTFQGVWKDFSREREYSINFKAHRTSSAHITCDPDIETGANKRIYDVTFSPGSTENSSKAVGAFYKKNSQLVGTFMTESGDYRFLQGNHTGASIELSSFDGAHLFYFCANVSGDSLTDGRFFSGNHWREDWVGLANADARLRDPDSLTYVTQKNDLFRFYALNLNGDSVLFDSAFFKNKVTIVQVFGSWCPNCTDESRFMKDLFTKNQHRGLAIVPVAFERTPDFEVSKNSVLSQFNELELEYEPYFGGRGGKVSAAKVFSQLNTISSFPTTIFIDQSGRVRKIHTGFYGPGTEEYYKQNTSELSGFVDELLNELEYHTPGNL
jgi:thiol-disulfide isomerase/thioredoxin